MKERYDDVDEYIKDLQAEILKYDNCATHHYNLGIAMLSKGDFAEAEKSFLNCLENSPHFAEAFVQLGGICMQQGDLEGCLNYNKEAANCRAKFAIPYGNIGFVHLQRGEIDQAITALSKAIKIDPKFVQALTTLASAYLMQGEYDRALAICNNAISIQPNFAPAWHNLALANLELKNIPQALEAYDKAIELGYDVPTPLQNEIESLRTSVTLDPTE